MLNRYIFLIGSMFLFKTSFLQDQKRILLNIWSCIITEKNSSETILPEEPNVVHIFTLIWKLKQTLLDKIQIVFYAHSVLWGANIIQINTYLHKSCCINTSCFFYATDNTFRHNRTRTNTNKKSHKRNLSMTSWKLYKIFNAFILRK